MHENQLWFTNIERVEQEISLRTECGMYYSYYKQLLAAPSINEGLQQLIKDNATEHGRTINALQRFNIYQVRLRYQKNVQSLIQEVLSAYAYRGLSAMGLLPSNWTPMLFYVYVAFALAGVQVLALALTAWYTVLEYVRWIKITAGYSVVPGRQALPLVYGCLSVLKMRREYSSQSIYVRATLCRCCNFSCCVFAWRCSDHIELAKRKCLYH